MKTINPHNYLINDTASDRNKAETKFLRDSGIYAIGIARQIELYNEWVSNVEQHVLESLDKVAESVCQTEPGENGFPELGFKGWFDHELPIFLNAIRKQAEAMWEDRVGAEILKAETELIKSRSVIASFKGKAT